MSIGWWGVISLFAINIWVLVGALCLFHSLLEDVLERPRSFVHSVVWMLVWPLLCLKLVLLLFRLPKPDFNPDVAGPGPAN